jgi:predicted nucleic acid-binding OB-fold protein
LSKNLELTEAQRSAVKKILVQRQEQTLRIRNSEEPGAMRIGQFRALQDQTINQIRAILTDEQKKKYDPLILRKTPAPDTPQRSLEDWIKATTPRLDQ